MILQALTQLYEDLVQRNAIARPGWTPAKISYALCIDQAGCLKQVVPLRDEVQRGKKIVLVPKSMELPAAVSRSSGILPNFLWDNSSYFLGTDSKGKPERSRQCFEASRALHHELLDDVDAPEAKAILAFFDSWQPQQAQEEPVLQDVLEDLKKGGNLVFRIDEVFAQEIPSICSAWDRHYNSGDAGEETAQCLVTGKPDVPERTHPMLKGVVGAQSSGASLVSFNAPAFCSYGKEQSLNAPVGKHAAFAYTAALNHLLADRERVYRIGDTTVVCWAEGADPVYADVFDAWCMDGSAAETFTEDDLHAIMDHLSKGHPCQQLPADLDRRFYILGLSPSAARISVRFFYNSTFGDLMRHVMQHHQRLEIEGNRYPIMPLWALLRETVNMKSTDKSPSPVLAGAVARSVFTGSPYPASLLEGVMMRIRAEREITPGRAAILKAYYLSRPNELCPEEVLTVSLNENSTNVPYTLGRLFCVYEALQKRANPGINTTIKDKYFNSASATPAMIFPTLDNLAAKHLRKLEDGYRPWYGKEWFDRRITDLKSVLGEMNPTRLTLPEQGAFNLGYYHQKKCVPYRNKEEK